MGRKFAHSRFETEGFTKNPDIRTASSNTDYVFRWLGCQFIKGYKEATSPNNGQTDLPMRELPEIDKKALNRPVSDLPRERPDLIDVLSHKTGSEGQPHVPANRNTHTDPV